LTSKLPSINNSDNSGSNSGYRKNMKKHNHWECVEKINLGTMYSLFQVCLQIQHHSTPEISQVSRLSRARPSFISSYGDSGEQGA
jgi:hypothetical protein